MTIRFGQRKGTLRAEATLQLAEERSLPWALET